MGLLTYEQLREKLNIKEGTAYSMVSRGQIPCVRLSGRLVRFDEKEIERWLAERRVSVPSVDLDAAL